jgi:hypothetical protein
MAAAGSQGPACPPSLLVLPLLLLVLLLLGLLLVVPLVLVLVVLVFVVPLERGSAALPHEEQHQ